MAANKNDAEAENYLALLYRDGRGVDANPTKAFELWLKSATQDNLDAQNNLGYCYDKGFGTVQNTTEAFKWWKKQQTKVILTLY